MLRIYTLANCDTCRRATRWLRSQKVPFEEIPIRERPPSSAELKTMIQAVGDSRRVFNTSGRDYREQGLGERLPELSESVRIGLLAGNGNLIKRPFLIGDGVALVGFDEKAWAAAFER